MSRANGEPETAAASFRSPLRLSLLVSKGEHSFTHKVERLLADCSYLGRLYLSICWFPCWCIDEATSMKGNFFKIREYRRFCF